MFQPTRYYTILVLINPLIYYFLGHGEQFNGITAFVDASNVYASHPTDTAILKGGKTTGALRITERTAGNLLPKVENRYRAGDGRAREMPGLLSMHTIWMREHNRIGKKRTYHIDAYKPPLLIKPPVQQNLNKPQLFWTKSPLFEAFMGKNFNKPPP